MFTSECLLLMMSRVVKVPCQNTNSNISVNKKAIWLKLDLVRILILLWQQSWFQISFMHNWQCFLSFPNLIHFRKVYRGSIVLLLIQSKMAIFHSKRKETRTKIVSIATSNMHHVMYFLGYNTSTKFQVHCFVVCRHILNCVYWHHTATF